MLEDEQLVLEADEVSQEPEAEKAEEVSETAVEGEVPQEKAKPNYYSPDEIQEILENDGKLDKKRLSPEGLLLQKSFEKGLGPKLNERAELKRRLGDLETLIRTQPPAQPRTIEEAYDQDPRGTLSYIDAEIAKNRAKIKEDPYTAIEQIENLRAVREQLKDRELNKYDQKLKTSEATEVVKTAIYRDIPDFDDKVDALTEYALNNGYSLDEVRFITNPANTGQYAAKWIKTLNKAYDLENAPRKAMKKEMKPTPPKTESAGRGETDTANATYAAAMKKAQATGDFTEVLRLKGTLDRLTVQ